MRFALSLSLLLPLLMSAPVQAMGGADDRTAVDLPAPMRAHMLGNMRDHLEALDEILRALAEGRGGDAAAVAEQRLGMSSMSAHGAAHMAPHMPEEMRALGTAMHRAASRFALSAEEADVHQSRVADQTALVALGEVTAQCTACHGAFRLK